MASKNVSLDKLGTYHIAQHPELYTPARNNNFVFMFTFPTTMTRLLKSGVDRKTATDTDYISTNTIQETLMLSVNEGAVPHYTQNVLTMKRGNGTYKFAGAVEYPSGSFKFNDFIGADTKSCIMAIRRLSFDQENETIPTAMADGTNNYKAVGGVLMEYSPDHRLIRYWDYYGVWINELSEGAFSSEDDGKREITATIQYDRAVEHSVSE